MTSTMHEFITRAIVPALLERFLREHEQMTAPVPTSSRAPVEYRPQP